MGVNAGFRPQARRDRLVVRDLEGETLVYDLDTYRAHYLNGVASRLGRRSHGRTSVEVLQDQSIGALGSCY